MFIIDKQEYLHHFYWYAYHLSVVFSHNSSSIYEFNLQFNFKVVSMMAKCLHHSYGRGKNLSWKCVILNITNKTADTGGLIVTAKAEAPKIADTVVSFRSRVIFFARWQHYFLFFIINSPVLFIVC